MKFTVLFSTLLFAQLLLYSHSVHLRQAENQAAAQPAPNTQVSEETVAAFCFINQNGVVFDLNPISTDKDYDSQSATGSFDFNVCNNMNTPCPDKKGIAAFRPVGGNDCVQIAGDSTVSSNFRIITDETTLKTTLEMRLPQGEICRADNTKRYTTTISFTCDQTAEIPVVENNLFSLAACENTINMKSRYACPKYNVYGLWNAVQENKYIFGTILIVLGIFLCFVGENFLKITQIIAGGALATIVLLYIIFNYTSVTIHSWQFWLILILSIAAGCVFGYFMSYFTWLPGVVFGFLLGFVVGFVIFNICLRFIHSNPGVVFWVTMGVCCIGGIILGYFKEEEISIISTSIIGAYAIVRGISLMAGGFPDERQVYELGNKGEWSQLSDLLTPIIYAYLAGFLILSAVGMYIQFKFFYDGDKKKGDKKDDNKEKEPEKQAEKEPLAEESK